MWRLSRPAGSRIRFMASAADLIIPTLCKPVAITVIVHSSDFVSSYIAPKYGYVKVPKSWIHFTEIEGGDDIQYCDGTDVNIVTLNTLKPEHLGVSESEYAALDAVQVSTSIYQTRKQSKDFSKVWGSKSKIGGYDAYVVNCIAKNGKYLVIWIFKSDDGKFRYVSLEGTPEVLKDMLPLIEQSWTVKKD